jgi:hypothetical protein
VLKLTRESAGLTQAGLAERLDVDISTVQAWESARRPLTAMKSSDLVRLRTLMLRLGALPRMFEVLADAVEADVVIADSVSVAPQSSDMTMHPLAASVHRRSLTSLLTWPLTGDWPPQLEQAPQSAVVRRGPVPAMPMLGTDDRTRFFDHLVVVADRCRGDNHALLRRQAIYLLGFDERRDTVEWLAAEQRRAVQAATSTDDIPAWVAVRSSAVALAQHGHTDPLRAFVAGGLTTDTQVLANLNYWAYWVGELPDRQPDDMFMMRTRPEHWSGTRLFPHLVSRLCPGSDQAELYIRTLWTLIATHPALLQRDRAFCSAALTKVEEMAAEPDLTAKARQELDSVAFAIRLSLR